MISRQNTIGSAQHRQLAAHIIQTHGTRPEQDSAKESHKLDAVHSHQKHTS